MLGTASLNGVIKIAKRSRRKFQFGDDEAVTVTVDIIEVVDQWHEVNFALRVLEGDMWTLPTSKVNEFAVNRLNFVQAIVNDAYAAEHAGVTVPQLTRIEAEEFIRVVQLEAEQLRNFTLPKSAETSSAPESTADRGVNFSQ